MTVHLISGDEPMVPIPERHTVVEPGRIGVGVLERPTLPTVAGEVDARARPRARAHQVGDVGIDCVYVAELEPVVSRDRTGLPVLTAVGRASEGRPVAAHPDDPIAHHTHCLEQGVRAGGLVGECRLRAGGDLGIGPSRRETQGRGQNESNQSATKH